jgi:alpha-D-xyloside xylohydrolase
LYEDEGDNYNYEKGAHALIPLRWSEKDKTLTIGEREGSYPGMSEQFELNIVWVSSGHGIGETIEAKPDRVVHYQGHAVSVEAP